MMKCIGLIGGLSWHSTALYYQHINQMTAKQLGGVNSACINMESLNFSPIVTLMQSQSWQALTPLIIEPAKKMALAGADGIIIANNTLHQIFPAIEKALSIPCLSIVDALGLELSTLGISKIGLLGTASTMNLSFYKQKLLQQYGIEVIIPSADKCQQLDRIIFSELCHGKVTIAGTALALSTLDELTVKGVDAIALACTELPLLYTNEMSQGIPLLDTSQLHCQYAVDWSLSKQRKLS